MRYTTKFLQARFKFAAEAMEWNTGPLWTKDADGNNRSTVDAVFLERGPVGGWRICQFSNDRGGERKISDTLSASELVAFIDGILHAKDFWQPTRASRKVA